MRESKRLLCLMAALGLPFAVGACTGVTDLGHSDAAVASCTVQGSAVDLSSDSNNCGACGHACASGQTCTAGSCVNETTSCPANHANCDGNKANGCEVDISVDSTNCGACGNVCASGQVCSQGQCVSSSITCQSGFADCNGSLVDGCEVNTATDPQHCGSCTSNCPSGSSCTNGQCQGTNGQIVCGSVLVDPRTDVSNCGGCGKVCPTVVHAVDSCVNAACVTQCDQGYGDCDGMPSNGCEVSLQSDATNCGACAMVCASGSTCSQGVCVPKSTPCPVGYDDCDVNPTNGCETNLVSDINNCAACNVKCSTNNATPVCSSGVCAIGACNVGYGNCDANNANGCEVDLSGDVNNCGQCGNACGPNRVCKQGGCTQTTPVCVGTFADCDGLATNGCEMNIASSVDNCGACGNKCSLPNATPACNNSACGIGACNNGYANCNSVSADGCEVNLQTDATHCGSCTTVCGSGSTCSQGSCIPNSTVCAVGYGNCNGVATDGCEVDLNTSVNHCGTCGVACTNPNGTTTCSAGVCTPTCSAGYADCDGNNTNGCEANLNTSNSNCGACGVICDNGRTCKQGGCAQTTPVCVSTFADCDGLATNGCEMNIALSVDNCGACGNKCSLPNATPACNNSACTISMCNSGFGDCDNNSANGCEVNLSTDPNNCGGCGNTCGSNKVCSNAQCT